MKKKFLFVALVVLALSVTGCNEKPVDGEVNVTSESTEESSVSQESTDSDVSSIESSVEESSSVQESTEQNQIITLEDYYSQPLQKSNLDAMIEKQKSESDGSYSDLGYYVKGNIFTYWYQYSIEIDKDNAVKSFDSYFTESLLSNLLDAIAAESGVEDVTVQYIYKDKDGNDIYNKCFVRGHLEDSIVISESNDISELEEEIDIPMEEETIGSTLEDLFSLPSVKNMMDEQIASTLQTYEGVYSDITFRAEGNKLIYTYQYAQDILNSSVLASLDENLKPTANKLISSYKSAYEGVTVQYIFLDKDGNEIFNQTYTE